MKRCPTCDRTFDDSMKFCQIDGTVLVDANTTGTETSGNFQDDADLTQTKIMSTDELRNEFAKDNPPLEELTTPSWMDSQDKNSGNFSSASSPFDEPKSSDYGSSTSTPFDEPSYNQSPFGSQASSSSFGNQNEWTPPPAPVSQWNNQNIGANTPFQTPIAGGQGQDKTLAIVSLVCGILSVTCCGAVTGIVALITGFMAKNNVERNPNQYGGRGMALAGIIMGGISIVLTVLYFIFVVLGGVLR